MSSAATRVAEAKDRVVADAIKWRKAMHNAVADPQSYVAAIRLLEDSLITLALAEEKADAARSTR